MNALTTTQKKKLRGMAHHLEPIILVGQKGLSEQLVVAIDQALFDHELIKVRFVECKEEKKEITDQLAKQTKSTFVGMIGNVAMLYRENPEKKKNKIEL